MAVIPPALVHVQHGSWPLVFVTAFSGLGWIAALLMVERDERFNAELDQAANEIGIILEPTTDIEEKCRDFAEQTMRTHRAAFAFQLDGERLFNHKLSENLRRITELAYHELNARSAELALFDEQTSMWTQAMLIGDPHSVDAQSMLVGEVERSASEIFSLQQTKPSVCAKPLAFSGSVFGALRVEKPEGEIFSPSDVDVLQLLATQGALMMIDAEFTDQLLKMRRLGEESTKAKTGFLANLSHEIRGPLGTILNGAELALEGLCGEVTEPMKEALKMIKDSGEHLLDLVNDVLDYAKVEAGKITPHSLELPLKPLLEDLVSVVRAQALAKHHKLTLLPVDPKLGILCDKRHIRQMLINFLTNAVKYTPDGGTISVFAEKLAHNRVKISIRDTGIGIPDTERDKVFGAFERVDDKYALTQNGTGLGMPLTKSLAEVNKGSVGFDSVYGQGSTFWLVMPSVEIDASYQFEADSEESVIGQGHGELILVVDHDQPTRTMLCRYLDQQGFRTVSVSSGAEMLKVLRTQPVELAIVENDFPNLPGEEMVATIRATPNAVSIPLILLSARAFVFDIERFLKLGVDRCLSKPVSLGELAVTSRRLIDQNRSLERPILQ